MPSSRLPLPLEFCIILKKQSKLSLLLSTEIVGEEGEERGGSEMIQGLILFDIQQMF